MFRDKYYLTTLFTLAFPMILQYFISSLLNMIDIMMVGQLGETAVAAVGLSNQIFFVLQLLLFGISSSAVIFSAQFWGMKDIISVRKMLGINLFIALSGSLLFSIGAIGFPQILLRLFTKDLAVASLGAEYLRITGFAYLPIAVTFAYSFNLRSTGNVRLPMIISIGAITIKTLMNYALIPGNLGFSAMGVEGAAIATCISRSLECGVLVFLIYALKTPLAARLHELLAFNRAFIKRFLVTSLPVIISETLWSLGIAAYNLVYARIGTEAIAAANIAVTIQELFLVIFIGITDALAIMVGNRIGAREEQKAFDYSKWTLILCIIATILLGAIVRFTLDDILSVYKISAQSHLYAHNILTIFSLTFFINVANMLLIAGIFRSGGDTRFSGLLDIGSVWLVGVPLAFFGAFVLHLPVHWVFLLVFTEELIKFIIGLYRFSTRRWINHLVQEM